MDLSFPFPFEPYPIQQKFMKELYTTFEKSRLGIFESPTGTGKSLSICCGTLQWLQDYNSNVLKQLENEVSELKSKVHSQSESIDWLQDEFEKIQNNQRLACLLRKLDKIKQDEIHFNSMKARVAKEKLGLSKKSLDSFVTKGKTNNDGNVDDDKSYKENIVIEDKDLVLDDLEDKEHNYCNDEVEMDKEEIEDDNMIKIYISSRTHSQLSQFVGEIKRTVFKDRVRVVTLGSRQHYCINADVSKLRNVNLINERCLDMQKSSTKDTLIGDDGKVLKKTKTKSCSSCPYYNQANITKLKERSLVDIMDMEDLVKNGKELKACPYYASRMALENAQVVLISHAGIVSAGARSGVSLKLKNNVLILDEAHGLTAALENAHSAPVATKQLSSVRTYLQFYINKYRARLTSKNLLTLNQINFVIGKFLGVLKTDEANKSDAAPTIYTLEDFVINTEIDHLNLRLLVQFCRNTKLAPKLHGFSMRYSQQALEEEANKQAVKKKSSLELFLKNILKKTEQTEDAVVKPATNAQPCSQTPTEPSPGGGLYALLDFLDMLCERSANGRVLVRAGSDGLLKYLLLNPAEHFSKVAKECRSVIVAGGTMEPISEFQSLLTGTEGDVADIAVVRCEHVVPPENVLAVCLSKGPSNVNMNFSYDNRQSKKLLDELGRILRNVCNVVPGGVVCFLPSYSYEQTVFDHLKSTNLLDVISKKKKLFREPKSAADVDKVLSKFAAAVKSKDNGNTGALLFSVVGGKLSEGLNFSDDLGRCVIVAGMPYPNTKSPELQEKMNYLNKTCGGGAGATYYENLCMKAVNQCIGRAVRHSRDYACVLLIEERYSRPHTVAALPSFVQKSMIQNCSFGQTIGSVAKFFSKHKS